MMTTVPFLGVGFRLDVPSTWMVFSTGDAQTNFLMPPYDANRAMNLAIRLSRVSQPATVQTILESARAAQSKNYADFVELSIDESIQSPAKIIQRVRWQPPEGEAVVQHNLFCVAEEHLIYALTATRPESLPADEAAAWDSEVDATLRTFTLQTPLPV